MQIRKHLTYANVMSSLAVFLILTGATAFAAAKISGKRLKSGSVTTAKLRRNSVTTPKIRTNAITTAKIRDGAVSGAKIAEGSITGANINLSATPFSRVTSRLRGSSAITVPSGSTEVYPLDSSTYTQAAEEVDTYAGSMDLTFRPECEAPREASAYLFVDAKDPTSLASSEAELVGAGVIADKTGSVGTTKLEIGPVQFQGTRFEPGSARTRTVSIAVTGKCKSGSGIVVSSGAVDVIGTR